MTWRGEHFKPATSCAPALSFYRRTFFSWASICFGGDPAEAFHPHGCLYSDSCQAKSSPWCLTGLYFPGLSNRGQGASQSFCHSLMAQQGNPEHPAPFSDATCRLLMRPPSGTGQRRKLDSDSGPEGHKARGSLSSLHSDTWKLVFCICDNWDQLVVRLTLWICSCHCIYWQK